MCAWSSSWPYVSERSPSYSARLPGAMRAKCRVTAPTVSSEASFATISIASRSRYVLHSEQTLQFLHPFAQRNVHGAHLTAVAQPMAAQCAGLVRHGRKARLSPCVALVETQHQHAVHRGRAEIPGARGRPLAR